MWQWAECNWLSVWPFVVAVVVVLAAAGLSAGMPVAAEVAVVDLERSWQHLSSQETQT